MNQKPFTAEMTTLALVFAQRRFVVLFSILALVLLFVYSALTDIILLFPLSFNPVLAPERAVLIGVIALLTALSITLIAFQFLSCRSIAQKSSAGFVGSIVGLFATACPICQPIWLVWLGLGSASIILVDYGLIIALIGAIILSLSVHALCRTIVSSSCVVPSKRSVRA